jgi:hypothetical protein
MSKHVVQIAKGKVELSKSQKEFNRLITKIEKTEQEIEGLKTSVGIVQKRVATDLLPLHKQYNEQRGALVKRFDRAHDSDVFKKAEKKKLADLITEMAFQLIEEAGMEELKVIYDKYDEDGFDATNAEADGAVAEMMKSMMAAMGIELDDDVDISNPQKFQEHLNQKMAEKQAGFEEAQRRADERRANKPKTAKQLEREEKKQLEVKNVTKAVRTIYMDLVKAFHPDREPDEAEKERKTEVMHRVTEAYENNDLLKLLRLQLEFERIDQAHLETLAEEQLKYYNKILKQQVQELDLESDGLQDQIRGMLGNVGYGFKLTVETIDMLFDRDIRSLKTTIKAIKKDLKSFEDDAVLKAFLKQYKIQKAPRGRQPDFFDLF